MVKHSLIKISKMKKIIIIYLIFSFGRSLCQTKPTEHICRYYQDSILKKKVYIELDSPAVFKNTTADYIKFILEKIKPKTVDESQEKIRFYLIINNKGLVIYVGFYGKYDSSIPSQIEKAFLKTKNWKPAKCNGKKVLYRFEGVYLI